MAQDNLRDHLAKLHEELSAADQADPAAREKLSAMIRDINLRIEAPAAVPPPDATLPDRLERIAVRFEANHPALAASARRLVDLLAEVGI